MEDLFANPEDNRRSSTSIEPLRDARGCNIIPLHAGLQLYQHHINILMGPQGGRETRALHPFETPALRNSSGDFLVTDDVASAGLSVLVVQFDLPKAQEHMPKRAQSKSS